jgi:hypothetical protein
MTLKGRCHRAVCGAAACFAAQRFSVVRLEFFEFSCGFNRRMSRVIRHRDVSRAAEPIFLFTRSKVSIGQSMLP